MEKTNWHWRNTMRPVRFFNLDARAAMPFLVLLLYARWITLFVTIVVTAVFWFVERKGLTFPAALRSLRVWLIGSRRPAWLGIRHRRMRDSARFLPFSPSFFHPNKTLQGLSFSSPAFMVGGVQTHA